MGDDSHLTKLPGVPSKSSAVPGMAHFAGTGPEGKTCGDCEHCGYYRQRTGHWDVQEQRYHIKSYTYGGCSMFKYLIGRNGPVINASNPSCKYFKQKLCTK